MTILPSLARLGRGGAPSWLPDAGGASALLYADFINAHYWSGGPKPDFAGWLAAFGSFARASSASYTGADGLLHSAASNAARFDYDPLTHAAKGLLLEGAATNRALQSEAIDNAAWSKGSAAAAANAATAPDGNTTADSVLETATTGSHAVWQDLTLVAGTTYTMSVFAKRFAGSVRDAGLLCGIGSPVYPVKYTLSGAGAVTVLTGAATPTSAGIQAYPNGWYRIWVTATANTTAGEMQINSLQSSVAAYADRVFAGSASEGLYLWGAQIEVGAFPTSYMATATASVTRAADSLSAAWSAIATGTIYACADTCFAAVAQRLAQLDDGSGNNRAALGFNASGQGAFDVLNGGTLQAGLTAGTVTAGAPVKLAAAFAANDFAVVAAGGTPSTDSSGAVPSFNALRFGADAAGTTNLFGHIAELALWNNVRAPNADLQRLTA